MPSVGELLRHERLHRNASVAEIAAITCISSRYLQAVEDDNLKIIPGDFFYRSFIRQYAGALNLDPAATQALLAAAPRIDDPDPIPALASGYQTARIEGRLSGLYRPKLAASLGLLALVVTGCSGLYALWHNKQQQKELAELSPAPAQPVAAPAPQATEPAKVEPEPSPAAEPAVQPPVSPQSVELQNTVSVDLAAKEKTWVSVSSHGKTVFSGVLGPEQTKNFAATEDLKLLTGNAAGLHVRWNGKDIGPVGPRGQVRVVLLHRESYEILAPSRL